MGGIALSTGVVRVLWKVFQTPKTPCGNCSISQTTYGRQKTQLPGTQVEIQLHWSAWLDRVPRVGGHYRKREEMAETMQQAGLKGIRCIGWVVLWWGTFYFLGILHLCCEVPAIMSQRLLPKNSNYKCINNTHVSKNRLFSPSSECTQSSRSSALGSWACIPLQRKMKSAEEPWISPPFYSTHSRHLINFLSFFILP